MKNLKLPKVKPIKVRKFGKRIVKHSTNRHKQNECGFSSG
jgi:hypothetical protein